MTTRKERHHREEADVEDQLAGKQQLRSRFRNDLPFPRTAHPWNTRHWNHFDHHGWARIANPAKDGNFLRDGGHWDWFHIWVECGREGCNPESGGRKSVGAFSDGGTGSASPSRSGLRSTSRLPRLLQGQNEAGKIDRAKVPERGQPPDHSHHRSRRRTRRGRSRSLPLAAGCVAHDDTRLNTCTRRTPARLCASEAVGILGFRYPKIR